MKRSVRLTSGAQRDLVRLIAFLDALAPQAAVAMALLLKTSVNGLGDLPERGRLVTSNLRELPVRYGDSGYILQYRVDRDAVIVVRIFHMRERRPEG